MCLSLMIDWLSVVITTVASFDSDINKQPSFVPGELNAPHTQAPHIYNAYHTLKHHIFTHMHITHTHHTCTTHAPLTLHTHSFTPHTFKPHFTVFRLFRGLFALTLFLFGLGVNVHVWTKYHINYVLIFELDPRFAALFLLILKDRHTPRAADFFQIFCYFLSAWCFFVLLYIFAPYLAHVADITGLSTILESS